MVSIDPLLVKHLVVPLDGSPLAEAALPAAIAVAGRLGAHVTLLHVLERDPPATIHGETHLASTGDAEAYLERVASQFLEHGISVERHAHPNPEGDVASSIAEHSG